MIAAAAVVLAEGAFSPELVALLGAERAAALADLLLRRAVAWAAGAAREVTVVEPADPAGAADVAAHRTAPDLAAALAAVPPAGGVLLVRAEVPRLGADHAADALGDLAAGCALTFGSTLEGDWYLAGLAAPEPELLAAVPGGELRAGGVGVALERARALGAEVGLLRHERALRRPADAAAHLADPLTPADVRAALSGASW